MLLERKVGETMQRFMQKLFEGQEKRSDSIERDVTTLKDELTSTLLRSAY